MCEMEIRSEIGTVRERVGERKRSEASRWNW